MHYNYNRRYFAGEADISLKMVRIDRDPLGGPPFAFRKNRRRCAWDTIFSWQSITITFSIIFLFIVGFFALCVCSNSTCHDEYGNNTTGCECSKLFCCCCCCRRRKRRGQNRGAADSSHCNSYSGRSTLPSTPPSSTTGSGITGTMVGTMLGNHHNTLPRSMYLNRPPSIPLSTVVNGGLHINASLANRVGMPGSTQHGPNGTCVIGNGPHLPGTAMPSHRVRHNSALASNMSSTYRAYQTHSPTPPPLVTSFGIIGRHPAPAPPAPPPPPPSTCSSSIGMPGSNGGGGTCGSSSSHQDTMQATTSSGGTTSGVGSCSGNIILCSDSVGGSASSSTSNQTFRTLHRNGSGQVVVGQYQQHVSNNNPVTTTTTNNNVSSSNCNNSYTSQATSSSALGGSGSDGSAVNGNVTKTGVVQPQQKLQTQPETPKCTVSKYSNKTVDCFMIWHIEYDHPELIRSINKLAKESKQ